MKRWWGIFRLTNRIPGLRWIEAAYFKRVTARVRALEEAQGIRRAALDAANAAYQAELRQAQAHYDAWRKLNEAKQD